MNLSVQFIDMWCVKLDDRDINYAIKQRGEKTLFSFIRCLHLIIVGVAIPDNSGRGNT